MSAKLDQFQNASVGMTVGIIEVRSINMCHILSSVLHSVVLC
jgi:hypothetical protein